jgi:CBS domain-containing protein
MRTVKAILDAKGYALETIAPDSSVFAALECMARREIGALAVVEDGALAGLLSERDYARKVILQGKSSRETLVRDIMTQQVITVTPQDTVESCMHLMTDKRIRHLPVLDDGRLAGIVSIGDVVKAVIDEQKLTIDELKSYISGRA